MVYKTFADFKNIKLKFGNIQEGMNYGYTALPNFPCESNLLFEDDYFLLYRRSEYAAQVELACAKIFKMLMGYGPEMEIVKEGDNFFIASRRIKSFVEGCPSIKNEDQYSHLHGIGSVFIIWYFLCQTDTHFGNYGTSDTGQEQIAFGLDMAEALEFEMLKRPILLSSLERIPYIVEEDFNGINENYLSQNYIGSEYFQNEKK